MAKLDTLRVRDYMSAKLITFPPDMDVMAAIHTLAKSHITAAPVVDDAGVLVGILSERDVIAIVGVASEDGSFAGPVSQFMNPKVKTVEPNTSLMQLLALFERQTCRRYPVMASGKLVGMISRSDVLRAISDTY
ncbi:MAG: CBS domain-containing protein [Nevskiaceae bacterium]|nr:MAG: CBS domain-containing protein [Nevskiaceae bacterium]TBR72584.1 MAG: CBS domain-containing protein [Nevskiaceae bacterium]